jgi:hypothetical protein
MVRQFVIATRDHVETIAGEKNALLRLPDGT